MTGIGGAGSRTGRHECNLAELLRAFTRSSAKSLAVLSVQARFKDNAGIQTRPGAVGTNLGTRVGTNLGTILFTFPAPMWVGIGVGNYGCADA